jgi:hypothetical protein
MDPNLARVLEPGYLEGIETVPIDQVRARRAECQLLENALSYVRRVAQGRLDLVGAELARRRAGGDPSDVRELIGQLPDILADRVYASGGGAARPPQALSNEDHATAYVAEVDAIFSPAAAEALAQVHDDDLERVRGRLEDYERATSGNRHAVHRVIDALQAEIARRYRTGEADVSSLLQ